MKIYSVALDIFLYVSDIVLAYSAAENSDQLMQ